MEDPRCRNEERQPGSNRHRRAMVKSNDKHDQNNNHHHHHHHHFYYYQGRKHGFASTFPLIFFVFAAVAFLSQVLNIRTTPTPTTMSISFTSEITNSVANFNNVSGWSEAVVVALSYVDRCRAARLRHLVETCNDNNGMIQRDVWVLHSHFEFDDNDERIIKSKQFIDSIPGLKSQEKSTKSIHRFDTAISGTSKSSFLRLLAEKNYKYGWHIEDDTFFTGPWHQLLSNPSITANDTDLVAGFRWNKHDWDWWENKLDCYIQKEHQCRYFGLFTFWMVVRASKRYASLLLSELETNVTNGHHEALAGPFSMFHNMTINELPQDYLGTFVTASWGEWMNKSTQTLERLEPKKNQLYHPVKCQSYPQSEAMELLIQKWG